jgi:hypothetical protein
MASVISYIGGMALSKGEMSMDGHHITNKDFQEMGTW